MMFAPVGSIASTVERNLRKEEFGGQPALGQVRGDSLLGPFRWNLRIEEHEHGRASSAEGGPGWLRREIEVDQAPAIASRRW